MTNENAASPESFSKTIIIDASPAKVWAAITVPGLMKQWIAETEVSVDTSWEVGSPIAISGDWYKTGFTNSGTVLAFEQERLLSYNHLSSLSRLADSAENYSIIEFRLVPQDSGTEVTVTLSNFPTWVIYKHLAFYWNVAVVLLKKFVEGQPLSHA